MRYLNKRKIGKPLTTVVALVLTVLIWHPAHGSDRPAPPLTAVEVVEAQLKALMNNDSPHRDAGIVRTFELAHPSNRRFTGPLARFTQMLKGPAYRPLLNHLWHEIEEIERRDAEVSFRVFVEASDGKVVEYLWVVALSNEGGATGAWLTTVVSPPRPAGQST